MGTIICNRKAVSIDWDKVININDSKALLIDFSYTNFEPYKRRVDKIITHHDICTSAHMCHKILKKNELSTHFCIDNDGTIYQFLDTRHKAWHTAGANTYSIGIDLSTAYDVKYQEYYLEKYKKPKPVETAKIHGQELGPFLGFYPEQLEAYKQLLIGLIKYYKIPLRYPRDEEGKMLKTFSNSCYKFKGIMCGYHVNSKKIDPPGLNLDEIVLDLRDRFFKNKSVINNTNVSEEK